ncbi:MAG: glycosyltransferase family 4 protein [Saprospiraceae bacterium]
MRILFLTDNFPPESNAPANRTYEHCVEWLKKGCEVTVITCVPNFPRGKVYPGYKNKLYQTEVMDGIKVIRVWTYITPNRGLFRRILDYMSFCISAFIASLFVKTDIIIATSPQLFTALAGYLSSFFKRKPWIMEVRDLWPESIKAVGAMRQRRVLKILDRLVYFLYHRADRIVVVTDAFRLRMLALGVADEKIHVVKNGVHLHKFKTEEKDQALIERFNLKEKFIVAYIGTHGMAHKLDFILDCAKEVSNKKIHFFFVGDGAMKDRLVRQAANLKLTNITFGNSIPKDLVPSYINLADVALIPLRKKDTFKKVLPSKIFENAAMKKPILLGVEGEAKKVVEDFNAGLCFEPENKIDFLKKLENIASNKKQYEDFQEGSIQLAKAFDRKTLAFKMYGVIESILYSSIKIEKRKEIADF